MPRRGVVPTVASPRRKSQSGGRSNGAPPSEPPANGNGNDVAEQLEGITLEDGTQVLARDRKPARRHALCSSQQVDTVLQEQTAVEPLMLSVLSTRALAFHGAASKQSAAVRGGEKSVL